jgi:septal ring factor EnvC (AmiA/AmiB activator)
MSWICPYCGTENYRMPLNSRHTPECTGCGENFITPEELESQIKPQIEAFEDELKSARHLMQEASDHISSLRDEMSSWEQKRQAALNDLDEAQMELTKLKTFKVFREVNREARARLDPHQKTLPFEEVPACV